MNESMLWQAERRFRRLPDLVNNREQLVRRGRWLSGEFLVALDAAEYYVGVSGGRIALQVGPILMRPWRFAVRADAETWLRFWEPVPEPGWHDLFALSKRGLLRIEGDLHPFMANLQYMKDVLAAPRTDREG